MAKKKTTKPETSDNVVRDGDTLRLTAESRQELAEKMNSLLNELKEQGKTGRGGFVEFDGEEFSVSIRINSEN